MAKATYAPIATTTNTTAPIHHSQCSPYPSEPTPGDIGAGVDRLGHGHSPPSADSPAAGYGRTVAPRTSTATLASGSTLSYPEHGESSGRRWCSCQDRPTRGCLMSPCSHGCRRRSGRSPCPTRPWRLRQAGDRLPRGGLRRRRGPPPRRARHRQGSSGRALGLVSSRPPRGHRPTRTRRRAGARGVTDDASRRRRLEEFVESVGRTWRTRSPRTSPAPSSSTLRRRGSTPSCSTSSWTSCSRSRLACGGRCSPDSCATTTPPSWSTSPHRHC